MWILSDSIRIFVYPKTKQFSQKNYSSKTEIFSEKRTSWNFVPETKLKKNFWPNFFFFFLRLLKFRGHFLADFEPRSIFLRNEFLNVFKNLFTITLFKKKTHIYDKTKNQSWTPRESRGGTKNSLRPKIDDGEILKLVGC